MRIHPRAKFCSPNIQACLGHHKDLHREILAFFHGRWVNYEYFKRQMPRKRKNNPPPPPFTSRIAKHHECRLPTLPWFGMGTGRPSPSREQKFQPMNKIWHAHARIINVIPIEILFHEWDSTFPCPCKPRQGDPWCFAIREVNGGFVFSAIDA